MKTAKDRKESSEQTAHEAAAPTGRGPLTAEVVRLAWRQDFSIFASEPFLKSVSSEYGWLGGRDVSGQLRCVLPYTIIRKLGLRFVHFRVATVPLGELEVEEERSFLDSVVGYFRNSGAAVILPSANSALFRTCPAGALAARYGTFVNDLQQSEETLLRDIHPSFRNKIRRAVKSGVQVKAGMEYLGVCYDLVAATLKRSGLSFKRRDDFERSVLALGDNIRLLVALDDGGIQGCMVAPFSEHSAYAWYCGSTAQPTLGAMQLLHWEAMRLFRAMGVRQFDFQGVRINPEKGSKQEGIMTFKKQFGGRLVQGYVWKYPLSRLQYLAYVVGMRLLHGGDIVDRELARTDSV